MPILHLQRTMRQLGRIRMGNKVRTNSGKERPNKLETWRLTSPFKESIEAAASLYGGTVEPWAGAPVGEQWEVVTESASIDIIVPPGDMAFSQWMEMWTGGGCARRCDQQIEQQSGEPCMCPTDQDERIRLAGEGRACKPTTRLSVMQPQLPDIGLWRLETHGWYGAIELAGTMEILRQASATGGLIPGRLSIEQRQVKRGAETRNFAVPVIELPTLTAHTLMTGEIPAGALPESTGTASGPAGVGPSARAALPAAEGRPVEPSAPRRASSRPSSQRRAEPEPERQPGEGTTTFIRAIQTKARRVGLDDEQLEAVCLEATGRGLAGQHDPADANTVLKAIDELQAASR